MLFPLFCFVLLLSDAELIFIVGNIFGSTDSFTCNVAQFYAAVEGLARVYAALLELHDDIHRFDARNVAGEVCADAEGYLYATSEVLFNLGGGLKVQSV